MDGKGFKELHEAIGDGDLGLVKKLLQHSGEEKFLRCEATSALFKAFQCEKYDIASYLVHIGAKLDESEVQNVYELEVDLDQLNYLLTEYNRKSEKSCIFRLLSSSQSPQGLDGERLTAVLCMYEELFKSEHIRLLMKVIEIMALDIVFDFESVHVNKIYRYNVSESEIFGLTLTFSNEIFVGAQNLLSTDSEKRAVYGVVAEELCHLALTILFENNANPYKKGDIDLKNDLEGIVLGVKSLLEHPCQIEQVIKDVYTNYDSKEWECELIARVPHVIGIYGEEVGKEKLGEYPELLRLLCFYEQHVIPKCEQYKEESRNMKHHQLMEDIIKKEDFMTLKEKTIQPLKGGFKSFMEHVVDENGISVITTNCTRLCMLQVYHELKRDSLEKKCLIFSRECFDDKRYEILDTLKANVWEYFILVLDKKELSLEKLKAEYLNHFNSFKTRRMKIVVISGLHSFGERFERITLNYKWNDLSEEYQRFRTCPLRYIFKGERKETYIKMEDVPKVFQNESEIVQLMSGEPFELRAGAVKDSRGFVPETYLNREFKVMAVSREILKNVPPNTRIFIFGLGWWDFEKLSIDEGLVQWLKRSDDDIQSDRKICLIEVTKTIPFSEWKRKNPEMRSICLHFVNNELILRNADSLDGDLKEYKKEVIIKEEEIIDVLKRKKILMISDNAGCGKSTVTSSLVRQVKEKISHSLVFRINLWKFKLESDYDFEGRDEEEDLFEEIFEMIGLENGFDRWHFKKNLNQSDYFLFFDGYDETPSKYKSRALKLISYLRRRTEVNIIITTRRHEEQELEDELNTYSHQLVPFDDEEQVNCLQNLLKWRLKYPFGEIDRHSQKNSTAISRKIKNIMMVLEQEEDGDLERQQLLNAMKKIGLGGNLNSIRSEIDLLDLTKLVGNTLKETKLEEKIIEFMGIPLHLFMVGSLLYFDNLNVKMGYDLHTLYSKFIERKILIYVEEKEGHLKEGNEKERMINRVREDAFRIHIQLADEVFGERKEMNFKEDDAELCCALGIVSIHSGKTLFLHQTFAEYFKAESIRRNIEKKVFSEIISEEKYEVVRRFLSCALEKKAFENISEELSKDLDFLFAIIYRISSLRVSFDQYEIDSDFISSIRIVRQLIKQFKLNEDSEFFKKFIEILNKSVGDRMDDAIWIGCCLNVEIIKHLINGNFKFEKELIYGFVRVAENVAEVIEVLKDFIFKESKSEGNEEERVLNRILELLRTENRNRIEERSF